MPPTTTRELQAQVLLLAAVVRGVITELPAGAASRVRMALEDALRAQAAVPENVDAATARLVSVLAGPLPMAMGLTERPVVAAPEAND